jgi:hypothetical protein
VNAIANNPPKRILIIAFGVPPTRGPRPARAWHLARHLPTHGWEAIVLTPRHPGRRVTVAKSREHRDYPIPLRQVADPSGAPFWLQETGYRDILLSWRKKMPRGNADQALPGLYGREIPTDEELALELPPEPRTALQRIVFALRCRPDTRAGWIDPAMRAARAVAQSLSFDAVLAPASPRSGQLVARAVAKERRVPLLVDDLPPSFDEADLGERVRNLSEARPPDRDGLPEPAPVAADTRPITLLHAGPTAIRGRDPLPALDGVRWLLDSGRVTSGGIRIRFLGARDPRLGPAVSARSLGSVVTLEPEVPWLVSLHSQAEASALLLCLGPGDACRLPDRAIESLCVRRPLFVIGPVDDVMRNYITTTGAGRICADAAQLADALLESTTSWSAWKEEGVAPFRAGNVAAELAKRL